MEIPIMLEISSPLRIVLVQENENDRLLFRRAFQKSDVSCEIIEFSRAEEALEQLGADASSFDVVAVDHNLPGISGMDLCRKLLDKKVPPPLVLMAEMGSEQLVAEALKAGVHDYIIKDPEQGYLELLPISLKNVVRRYDEYCYYKRIKQMLQNPNQVVGAFLEAIPDTTSLIDTEANLLMINKAGAEKLHRSIDEIIGRNVRELIPEDVYELRRSKWMEVIRTGKMLSFEDERDGMCFETRYNPVFNSQGQVEQIAIFAHDITERKKTEKALRKSEEKFRLAMEVTNDALWDWNMTTNEVYRNPRHATMFGYESHELTALQDEWETLIHPDDRQAVLRNLNEHIAGKRDSFEIEYRIRTKSGDYVWVLGRGKIVAYNDDGSPARMIGTNIDITERKKQYERDEIILKTCIDGFWLIDTQGRILEANDAYCRMSGYSRDELLTMNVHDVEAAEEPEETLEHIQRIKDKGFHRFESSQRRKDGTIMDLDISVNYLELDGGRTFAFFRDITDSKKAAEALRKSEATYRILVEQLPAITYIAALDETRTTLYVSPQVEDLIGFTAEEYKSDQDVRRKQLHPNDRDRVLKTVLRSHAEKTPFVEEYRMIAKNGSVVWFRDEAVIVKDEKNQPLFLQGVMYDITRHRQADEEIRKFKTISDNAGHGVAIVDLQGNLVYVNDSFARMHQYSVDELIGKNLSIFHTEEQMESVNQLNDQLKQQGSYIAEEVWHKKRDNTVFPTLMSATLVRDEGEEPLFMAATAIDMTKHKKAEELLRYSEERYRSVVEDSPVLLCSFLPDGEIVFVNTAYCKYFGKTSEELIGKNFKYLIPEGDRQGVLDNIVSLTVDSPIMTHEHKVITPDGRVRWQRWTNRALFDEHGRAVSFQAFGEDITEQRSMETALAESEEKYRTLVECAGDPISTIDERGVFLFANKQAEKDFTGLPDGLVGKTLWDLFPKEIADREAANVRKVIETGQRINTVSLSEIQGRPCWYNVTIEPLRDDRGSVTAAMVFARNIDDIMRAEEQIQKLSSAIESSINGIVIGDVEGNLTFVNNSFLKMWGYKNQNEVLGRNAAQFWKVNDRAAEIENSLQSGEGWIGELTAVRKDGSLFDIQVCQTSIRGENGTITSLMASFVDITESKRKEEELSKYRGQMARAEQLASLGTLSATVAHQLTQPLTVIRLSMDNALDELEATSSSETVIRRLKESVTQVSNITSIIGNFRNFARKSSGKTITEVNLKAVAVRIATLLSESARSANIVLRVGDISELPCPWMNETDLEQLFFALIENSIQAADGEKTRQLVISGVLKDKHIELRITDDCGGIAPENLDKIFEPFFTTKPRGQGTGLGLCIVQDVVSRIGGHVRIESEFGKGTTFIINIPIEKDKIS
jgi:PAS domain S-box-containing protein